MTVGGRSVCVVNATPLIGAEWVRVPPCCPSHFVGGHYIYSLILVNSATEQNRIDLLSPDPLLTLDVTNAVFIFVLFAQLPFCFPSFPVKQFASFPFPYFSVAPSFLLFV